MLWVSHRGTPREAIEISTTLPGIFGGAKKAMDPYMIPWQLGCCSDTLISPCSLADFLDHCRFPNTLKYNLTQVKARKYLSISLHTVGFSKMFSDFWFWFLYFGDYWTHWEEKKCACEMLHVIGKRKSCWFSCILQFPRFSFPSAQKIKGKEQSNWDKRVI